MSGFWIKPTVATMLVLGVAACTQSQSESMSPTRATTEPASMAGGATGPEAYDDWSLMIDIGPEGEPEMAPIATVLQQHARARGVLQEMLLDGMNDAAKAQFDDDAYLDAYLTELLELAEKDQKSVDDIAQLRAKLMGSTILSGVSGSPALQFLHAYITGIPQPARGKIREYSYNEEHMGGYLEVDTEVDTVQGGVVVQTDKYFWAIAVQPGDYEIFDVGNDPAHPFPGSPLDLSGKAAEIAARRLDQKLSAVGTGIVVLGVTKNGTPLAPGDPWLDSTASSCIDLMFWGFPPKSELPRQKSYCLGRCAHPAVVNTE